jgi:hypothetical protein
VLGVGVGGGGGGSASSISVPSVIIPSSLSQCTTFTALGGPSVMTVRSLSADLLGRHPGLCNVDVLTPVTRGREVEVRFRVTEL